MHVGTGFRLVQVNCSADHVVLADLLLQKVVRGFEELALALHREIAREREDEICQWLRARPELNVLDQVAVSPMDTAVECRREVVSRQVLVDVIARTDVARIVGKHFPDRGLVERSQVHLRIPLSLKRGLIAGK